MVSIKSIDKTEYNFFWERNNLHILQSIEWGLVKQSEGWECKLIGIFEDTLLINVVSIQIKSVNYIRFGYIPKTLLNRHFQELKDFFNKELKLAFVIFEFDLMDGDRSKLPSILINYNDHIQPAQTNIVKLNKTEAELFMLLKGNYRRNIKKGNNDGLVTKIYTYSEEAVDSFYKVLTEVFSNTKFLSRPKSYFSTIWKVLSNSKKAVIITASIGDDLLGSYFIVFDNLKAYELYGGVTRRGRDYEAGYVLKWEAIKYFNLLGKISYDHWGVSKRNLDGTYQKDELYNISSFKEGFGGEYIEFPPAKVLVIDETKFKFFSLLKGGGKILVKIKKVLKF